MDIEKTIRALTGRGFAVQHFATGREAADYLRAAAAAFPSQKLRAGGHSLLQAVSAVRGRSDERERFTRPAGPLGR